MLLRLDHAYESPGGGTEMQILSPGGLGGAGGGGPGLLHFSQAPHERSYVLSSQASSGGGA